MAAKKPTTKKPTAAKTERPKYQTVDQTFIGQTSDGELRVPLRLKTSVMRAARKIGAEGGDDIDILFQVLEGIGNAKAQEVLDNLDVLEATEFAEAYFGAYEKMRKASLGEPGELLEVIEGREQALQMDFARMGIGWDFDGPEGSWSLALALIKELARDTGSHLYAAVAGYTYVASMADIAQMLHFEAFINANREQGREPFKFPLPFSREPEKPEVTPEERREGKEALAKRSAFRNR